MRSDQIRKGIERAPHRALLKATGVTDSDMEKPFIAIVNSYVDIVPGHVHLQEFGRLVKDAVRARRRCALRIQHHRRGRRHRHGARRDEIFPALARIDRRLRRNHDRSPPV